MLGISYRNPFPKCPGKKNTCKNGAGVGTTGDFYGLGEHTGHYGVGMCRIHDRHFPTIEKSWEYARRHMEAFKALGHHLTDDKTFEEVSRLQAIEVEKYNEIQRGMDLVVNTLKDFQNKVESKDLTEWVSGAKGEGSVLKKASDVTRMDLALRIAKTLSSVKLDEFKLAAQNYIHVSEITVRIPKEIALGKRMFAKLRDLLLKYKEGERNPIEQIESEFLMGLKEVWSNLKSGEKS
jgi:hypothetical protein